MAAQKILSKYVVKVINPETGVILYASPFPCPFLFTRGPDTLFSFNSAVRIASYLKRFYPLVSVVAVYG